MNFFFNEMKSWVGDKEKGDGLSIHTHWVQRLAFLLVTCVTLGTLLIIAKYVSRYGNEENNRSSALVVCQII